MAGVETSHVSGRLDVAALLRNINKFVQRSGAALTGATGEAPPKPLSEEDIRKLSEVVDDPSFDVYVGKQDDTIRKVSGRIEFDVPEESRSGLNGIESGSLEFSVEFADVNGDQEIEAPAEGAPARGAHPVAGRQQPARRPGRPGRGRRQPDDGDAGTGVAPVQPNGTGTAPNTPDADDFKAYADCLDKARPEDTDALQRCSELLYR